jgi:transketolase
MVQESLKAADILAKDGIKARVIDMHTIKPIDSKLILEAANETGAIVTAEEHNIIGGLGSAVCEVIAEAAGLKKRTPVIRVGVRDEFGRSGDAWELLELYGMSPASIAEKAKEAIQRK